MSCSGNILAVNLKQFGLEIRNLSPIFGLFSAVSENSAYFWFQYTGSVSSTEWKGYKENSPVGRYFWEFLVGGVPPGSPNPNPISDQKMSFSRPVFRTDL